MCGRALLRKLRGPAKGGWKFRWTIKSFHWNLYRTLDKIITFVPPPQTDLSALTETLQIFKDFKALKKQWWITSTLKHFKDLYESWICITNIYCVLDVKIILSHQHYKKIV